MLVARSIDAGTTVEVLERLVAERGAPEHLRCDNGTELTSHALRDWCRFSKTETAFIEPGSPWQNPYVESSTAVSATSCSTSRSSPAWPRRAW